jgi:hypothetical protein
LIFVIPLLKILDQLQEGVLAARCDFLLGRSVARDQVVGILRLASLPVVQEDLDRVVVGAIVALARRGLSLRDAETRRRARARRRPCTHRLADR